MSAAPRGSVSALAAAMLVVGLLTVAVGLGALPSPIGSDDPGTAEAQLDSVIDDAVGDELRQHGVGGVAGETEIGTVRAYENPSGQEHFRVESDQPTYWRTGAYDVYSGTGWYRSNDAAPSDRTQPPGTDSADQTTSTVEIQTPTTRVPTPWRPTGVDADDASFSFSGQRGIEADSTLSPGDEITVQSVQPRSDPEVLQGAGTAYPDEIESRYTELPSATPDRVRDRTKEITADAETPYETAVAVRDWLRANRGYTLDVPPPEGDVADELLFERQAAHCAYFATTMATMLRAEDIPTRYAVGYTSGDRVDENEYVLRDAHAHAWVEVYFPDVGWVPFEPTPSAERSAAVADAVDTVDDDEFDGAASFDPSPPEQTGSTIGDEDGLDDGLDDDPPTDDPPGDDPPENDTGSGEEEDNGSERETPSFSIELLDEPVAGEALTVSTTTEDGYTVDGRVQFDGESIGEIEFGSSVTGEVPYSQSLLIEVWHEDTPESAPPDDRQRVDVTADLAVEYTGKTQPGGDGQIEATLNDEPLSNATVRVDGEAVPAEDADGADTLQTDQQGAAPVSLPMEPAGTATITVERGDLQATTTVPIDTVSVTVEEPTVVLPGRELTVSVASDGDPIDGLDLALDGETARTDEDGIATFTAPVTTEATVAVEGSDSPATATVQPLVTLGIGLGLVVGVLGVGVLSSSALRSNSRPAVVSWLIGGGRWARAAGATVRGRTAWVTGVATTVLVGVRTRLGLLRAHLGGPQPFPGVDRSGEQSLAVAAWGTLVRTLPGDHRTSTPRAITDRAISAGFPAGPCERLLAAYRAVRYGGRSPDDGLRDRVGEAIDALTGHTPEGDG